MTYREELAKAGAMRAHLLDSADMKDADAMAAQKRAMIYSVILVLVLAGGYYGIRRGIGHKPSD